MLAGKLAGVLFLTAGLSIVLQLFLPLAWRGPFTA